MKLQHDTLYPGLDLGQFYNLYQDSRYHDAVCKSGKVGREDAFVALENGQLRSAWTCVVGRSLAGLGLDGVFGRLTGARRLFPNGVKVSWRESHTYAGRHGEFKMELLKPTTKALRLGFAASAELEETPQGLVRHLQIAFEKPSPLLAPCMGIIASEIEKGLTKADAFTATWLRERPGQYRRPLTPTLGDPVDDRVGGQNDADGTSDAGGYLTASEALSQTSYHSAIEQDLAGFSLERLSLAQPQEPTPGHRRALSAPEPLPALPQAEPTLRASPTPRHRRWRSMFGPCMSLKVSA